MKLLVSNLLFIATLFAFAACKKDKDPVDPPVAVTEDPATFKEISSLKIGGEAAAEISAYDDKTKRLFVVNNDLDAEINQIDVVDLADPSNPKKISFIDVSNYGLVNSVDIFDGKLAAAIEDNNKQANGRIVVYNTNDYSEVKVVTVGALPDMVTYTKDGKFILTANEGEPSQDYTNDPEGSVSIIDVQNNYTATTIDFSGFASQVDDLKEKGFRIFGISNDFAKDIEPEYITVSADSKTAWVTLQENNAIAKIDITAKSITNIFPLGFKDYSLADNAIDVSDEDDIAGNFKTWANVKGMYMPDGIAMYEQGGIPYLFTANEGDAREYEAFEEISRVKNLTLDPTVFTSIAELQEDENLGRLNVTTTLGDADGDGKYEALYSLGARSFSAWNGNTGAQVFDSKNELDKKAVAAGAYADGRSDDKSIEPEGITIGKINDTPIAFVGMERVKSVAIYDISNPQQPEFLQWLTGADGPEGLLFIPADKSPVERSLLIVSNEYDGTIKIYQPDKL